MLGIRDRNLMLFILFIYIFPVIWVVQIIKGDVPYVDLWTRGLVDTLANSPIYSLAYWITNFGSKPFLFPFTIIVGFIIWLFFRDWLPALLFSGGTLGSHLLNMLIKAIVARERPSILIEANAEGF